MPVTAARCVRLVSLCGLALPSLALAAHPLTTDDAGTLGARGLQAELSSQLDADASGAAVSGAAALHLGLLDAVDVGISVPVLLESGLGGAVTGPLQIDCKWALPVQLGAGGQLALRAAWEPGGAQRASALAIASFTRGPLALHLNGGVAEDLTAPRAVSGLGGVRADLTLGQVVLLAELFATMPRDAAAELSAVGGVQWALPGGPSLSFGVGVIGTGADTHALATVGLTADLPGR